MSDSPLCVDAGVVIRLVADPEDEVVRRLWEEWDDERRPLAAPTLLRYEVTSVLYRYERAGLMSADSVRLALGAALALRLHGEDELHECALEIAERFSLPAAYDADYLALAERLGAAFWTTDERLTRAVRPSPRWVHLVGEQVTRTHGRFRRRVVVGGR